MLARNAGFCLLLLLLDEVYSYFGRVDNPPQAASLAPQRTN
jgi:hypothetical protein